MGKASQMKLNVVYLCSSVNTKNIDEAILKATTHTSNKPPSDKYVKFLQSTMATCYCPQTISGIVQRLCVTTDVCVASKCLILIHNMIKSEKGYEGEDGHRGTNSHRNLIYNQGESNLKLDDLNSWFHGFNGTKNILIFTYALRRRTPNIKEKFEEKRLETQRVSSYTTDCIFKQVDFLVNLFEQINARPDTSMERPNIIVIRMIGLMEQDYVSVIRLIKIRFEELDKRTADPAEMIPVLVRLDKCRESLSEFCWRCEPLDKEFWDLVLKLKAN
ncbi:LOW QUALITY PROTEIN: hypothetical protein HID58_080647 [Brassica napus]|uniref:ENTH domain-containing protein n=1 Tax=Brassica napus TaxID=3708 RepID=A0ABQ7Y5K3_BRANA|nr:LOW QUALITY PROTEIN: hypothetical protein HID58_080647 [Brassica napus]